MTKNRTVVIDGGTCWDSGQLVELLKEKSRSHVDAWFFTHPHHDHIGCFIDIMKNHPSITVGKLYYRFPDLTDPVQASLARGEHEAELWQYIPQWKNKYETHEIEAGESFDFDEVRIRVLRVFNPELIGINGSSAVYRIEGERHSVLILGDLDGASGYDTLNKCPLELLQTDYTQMSHHGQNGVSREFYEYIKPKRCIWPAPDWLWNNDEGEGFDTGPYQTVRTREWMAELGVTEHFVEADGVQKIEI